MVVTLLSDDPKTVDAEVAELRSQGQEGLDSLGALRREYRLQVKAGPERDAALAKLDAAIDRVGAQLYCTYSHLYWYNDLAQAEKAAQASGKPILDLHMMGNLTDEFSCANSRFFRTTLYANPEVAAYLHEHFVLCWESERPVPKVTIDFGDGRKLERTITGNSIHYVLDSHGRVLDGLPGLYGPAEFQHWLQCMDSLNTQCAAADDPQREKILADYHNGEVQRLAALWMAQAPRSASPGTYSGYRQAALISAQPASLPTGTPAGGFTRYPSAREAGMRSQGKGLVETPMLTAMDPAPTPAQFAAATDAADAADWQKIAALHPVTLDSMSRSLIKKERPELAGKDSADKLQALLENFQSAIAEDSVRNEFLLHAKLHAWLAADAASAADVEALNERVYAELFLTPKADPWLGLAPANVYSALPNNGESKAEVAR
jgi:hypothetical protein